MKIHVSLLSTILVFFAVVLTASKCNDDEECISCCETYVTTLDTAQTKYIDINEGSWWAFEDSASGAMDTLRLCSVDCFLASESNCYSYDTRANYYDSCGIFQGFFAEVHYAVPKDWDNHGAGDSTWYNYINWSRSQCDYPDVEDGTLYQNTQFNIFLSESLEVFNNGYLNFSDVRHIGINGLANTPVPGFYVHHASKIGIVKIFVRDETWVLKDYYLP